MKLAFERIFVFTIQAVAAVGILACSTTTTAPNPANDGTSKRPPAGASSREGGAAIADGGFESRDGISLDASSEVAADASGSEGDGIDGSVADDGGACETRASEDDCILCCGQSFPEGRKRYANAYAACLCVSPGTCKLQCAATECAPQRTDPDSVCDDCLAGSGSSPAITCFRQAGTACRADTKCEEWRSCFSVCTDNSK
jgi:hypothetical protein